MIARSVYVMPMPLTKEGKGPAAPHETALVEYEVWDQNMVEVCLCRRLEDAQLIARLLNCYHNGEWEKPKPRYYECPTCGTNDLNDHITCNHPMCPDGRDQS